MVGETRFLKVKFGVERSIVQEIGKFDFPFSYLLFLVLSYFSFLERFDHLENRAKDRKEREKSSMYKHTHTEREISIHRVTSFMTTIARTK